MTMNTKDVINYINAQINENVAPEDRKEFIECISKKLEKIVRPEEPMEAKYEYLLTHLLDVVNQANETEGVNPNLISASLG